MLIKLIITTYIPLNFTAHWIKQVLVVAFLYWLMGSNKKDI